MVTGGVGPAPPMQEIARRRCKSDNGESCNSADNSPCRRPSVLTQRLLDLHERPPNGRGHFLTGPNFCARPHARLFFLRFHNACCNAWLMVSVSACAPSRSFKSGFEGTRILNFPRSTRSLLVVYHPLALVAVMVIFSATNPAMVFENS